MSNFQPLEFVDRSSETQPQMVENLNKFTYDVFGWLRSKKCYRIAFCTHLKLCLAQLQVSENY